MITSRILLDIKLRWEAVKQYTVEETLLGEALPWKTNVQYPSLQDNLLVNFSRKHFVRAVSFIKEIKFVMKILFLGKKVFSSFFW